MSAVSRRMLVLVPLLASACYTWRPVPLAPRDSGSLHADVRVVLRDGQAVELEDGRISPDSVVGMQHRNRIAIPRESVGFLQKLQYSPARTISLVVGVPLAVYGLLAAAFAEE
jgi:hypothetical protein